MKQNYQKELEKILARQETAGKTLLLHSCCAPCSSYVLTYLRRYFAITVFYYNPNLTEAKEYRKRAGEQKRLIGLLNKEGEGYPIRVWEADYEPARFLQAAKGLEDCPEGGERCRACFALRLSKTAEKAAEGGFAYFTTTLTISPLKNAEWLNEIGREAGKVHGVSFLPSDFKKKEGYRQSVALSRKYDLYRQDYCGCVYSKRQREAQRRQKAESGQKAACD